MTERFYTEFLGVRVTTQVKLALEKAAGTVGARGSNGRATTLAREMIVEKLVKMGYLPQEREHAK